MDPQWQYQDPLMAGRPPQQQFASTTATSAAVNGLPSTPSKYAAAQPSQPPMGYTYEAFQTPSIPSRAPSMGSASAARPSSMAPSPSTPSRSRDYAPTADADTTMEDADPYNRAKYSVKTNHYARPSSQYFPTEESTAARRYSPKNALSPSAPYHHNASSPSKSHHSYAFPPPVLGPNSNHHNSSSTSRSPTRGGPNYTSPPQSYQSPPCEYSGSFFILPFLFFFSFLFSLSLSLSLSPAF
jgi:dual specificity protein kinase YAK1